MDHPEYKCEEIAKQEFKCEVTFQGKSFEVTIKGGKQDAKRAVARKILDTL